MALNANALVTLAQAKSQLDIPAATLTEDDRVELLINATSEAIEEYLCYIVREVAYTETYDGTRQNDLLLAQTPVTAITEIRVDYEREFAADTVVDAEDYQLLASSLVRRHSEVWPSGSQNIRVQYTAGYAEIPADLQYACLMFVEWLYRMREDRRIGRKAQGKSGESITWDGEIPASVKALLQKKRRTRVAGGRVVRSA